MPRGFVPPSLISGTVMGGIRVTMFDPEFTSSAYVMAHQIDKLGAQFKTWKSPLQRSLKEVIIPSIRKNFQAEGRPERWAPLSDATVATRVSLGFGPGPILTRTGLLSRVSTQQNLWDYVTTNQAEGAQALMFRSRFLDQKVPYAKFHHHGTTRPGKRGLATRIMGPSDETGGQFYVSGPSERRNILRRMPARPFIMLQGRDVADIYEIFVEYLTLKVNEYWGFLPDEGL